MIKTYLSQVGQKRKKEKQRNAMRGSVKYVLSFFLNTGDVNMKVKNIWNDQD